MKKLLLIFAVIFSITASPINLESNSKVSEPIPVTVLDNSDFKDCEIEIKGTYNGIEVDVVVTVEVGWLGSCAKAAGKLLSSFAGI
ncbi:hypothetical protein [Winogradskyella immobilis]|uniref:Uncharacterized protein n=1 Tax=Winogradskyella immobilis TaxID=2816852 RepID=A0ABS8EMP8_9FLAO|nr:hypothetical protein [Winogradskyella immobilis]MCC1484423.1 hypothetical protein [Winogradskyella immobilis]MCG0016515.1 hypothetical protein [Winogradskyella immobilis]